MEGLVGATSTQQPGKTPDERSFCYHARMRNFRGLLLATIGLALCVASANAQGAAGAIDLDASVTPTGAKPEPARDFTLYILTHSYKEIVRQINEQDAPASRDKFIDEQKLSPQLKQWMHKHEVMDLTQPGIDKMLSTDDIMTVPEFLSAYQGSNSGGVTQGIPQPKFRESEKQDNPAKYQKQYEEYLAALRKFIQSHPETIVGIELELDEVNPARKWAEVQNNQKRRVSQLAPAVAQTKYLAAKVNTDLNGHAAITGIAPGNYWISSLDLYAASGDVRLRWDVPVTVEAGRTTRIELTNLNATGTAEGHPD